MHISTNKTTHLTDYGNIYTCEMPLYIVRIDYIEGCHAHCVVIRCVAHYVILLHCYFNSMPHSPSIHAHSRMLITLNTVYMVKYLAIPRYLVVK